MDPRVLEYLAQKISKMTRAQMVKAVKKAEAAGLGLVAPSYMATMPKDELKSLAITCALLIYRHQEGASLLGDGEPRRKLHLRDDLANEPIIKLEQLSDSTILKLVS